MRASSLPLLTKCPGSAFLPQDDAPKSEEAQKGADWGTMVHTWKETGDVRGPDRRTESSFKSAISKSGIDRLALWPDGGRHEVALAIRVDGTREVRASHDKVFGVLGWITGTGDFTYWLYDGELWIDDLKTGKVYPDENGQNRFPQDPASAQLKCYALAIARLLGYTGVVHISVTHWPRLPVEFRHRPPERLWATFTTEELDDFYTELEQLFRDVRDAAVLRPGAHCRFCPSRLYCLVAEPIPESKWARFRTSDKKEESTDAE